MDILRDDAGLIDWDLGDVVYYEDSLSLATVGWFDNPLIDAFWWLAAGRHAVELILLLSQLMEMAVKICELVWQIVSIWNDIKGLLAKFLLHLDDIGTKTIFSCELKTVWEMVDLLVVIEALVNVLLIRLTRPEDIPVVSLCWLEGVGLQH